jgi:hypothetical protein
MCFCPVVKDLDFRISDVLRCRIVGFWIEGSHSVIIFQLLGMALEDSGLHDIKHLGLAFRICKLKLKSSP